MGYYVFLLVVSICLVGLRLRVVETRMVDDIEPCEILRDEVTGHYFRRDGDVIRATMRGRNGVIRTESVPVGYANVMEALTGQPAMQHWQVPVTRYEWRLFGVKLFSYEKRHIGATYLSILPKEEIRYTLNLCH